MCLGVSLMYEAELKRTLAGRLVETSVKGGKRLTSSGLGVRPPY